MYLNNLRILTWFIYFIQTTCIYFDYYDEDLTNTLKLYAKNYPSKMFLYSIGKSILKKELWVVALADENPHTYVSLRTEIKFVGNMHGIKSL